MRSCFRRRETKRPECKLHPKRKECMRHPSLSGIYALELLGAAWQDTRYSSGTKLSTLSSMRKVACFWFSSLIFYFFHHRCLSTPYWSPEWVPSKFTVTCSSIFGSLCCFSSNIRCFHQTVQPRYFLGWKEAVPDRNWSITRCHWLALESPFSYQTCYGRRC